MERSPTRQVVDTLHLMLRILLGFVMAYASVATAVFIGFFILLGIGLSSKYGPVYKEDIFWPMTLLLVGSLPSIVAAGILIVKNKLAARNLIETALGAINLLPGIVFMELVSSGIDTTETPELPLVYAAAVLYGASAACIIYIAIKERRATSVKSSIHLVK